MRDPSIPLRRIEGRFYRAIRADRVASVLAPPTPESAGRYHRPGQAALYITPEVDWAVIAIGGYMLEDGLPLVVVPLDVTEAWVIDQHDLSVCAALGIERERSNEPWRAALQRGEEPASWHAADAARAVGADGIVDRSRGIAGGWHVTLFGWNALGCPSVTVSGSVTPALYGEARLRWPSPPGWISPEERQGDG